MGLPSSTITDLVLAPFRLPAWWTAAAFGVLGALLTASLTRLALRDCGQPDRGSSRGAAAAGLIVCAAFTWCMLEFRVQQTPIVRPAEIWSYWRIGYHVALISLMLAAVTTDLRAYLIPDRIIAYGLTVGVVLAGLSGDLQIEHLWVDWNQEIPHLKEAYIPEWIKAHPHWHGFAWSLAGAACGACGTWLIRALASLALGQEAMGTGDITLMAMIGSFLGWQPTVVVLLLAPLCGLVIGALLLLLRGAGRAAAALVPAWRGTGATRSYLPYGPFLCLASCIVLFTWKWIWMFELHLGRRASSDDRLTTFAVRRLFGDWPSLLLIAGGTLAALVVVLFVLRVYRRLPVGRTGTGTSARSTDTSEPDAPMPSAPQGDSDS